jgi:peroxiredoxin
MPLAVGDRVPDVQLKMVDDGRTETVSTGDVLGKGRVVLFGVPAAFSPTCSDVHVPGFVVHADDLRARGVDRIFCISVNDAYVMAAWARSQGAEGRVAMLADGNGEFARASGLEFDLTRGGMGLRNQRYAAVIQDGVITHLSVEQGPGLEVSSAEAVLGALG